MPDCVTLPFPCGSGMPRRRVFLGAMLEPLLDRFVSDNEAEALRRIGVGRPFHVEVCKRNRVLNGFCSAFLNRREVELIVNGAGNELVERLREHNPESLSSEALTLEEIFVATLKA